MAVPLKSILKNTQVQYNSVSTNGIVSPQKSVEFLNHTDNHLANHMIHEATPMQTASSFEEQAESLYSGYGVDEYEVEAIVGHKKVIKMLM